MKRKINPAFLFPVIALALLIYTLSNRMFGVPPLGRLLNPFSGAVRCGDRLQGDQLIRLSGGEGLQDSVRILFDERRVPHVFAKNTRDLFYAQGYVAASLRLWQMDFISYASAGRLSEILGENFLGHDRNQRRMGIPEAARSSLQMIEQDPGTDEILTAYTGGVNAYIRQLSYKDLPLEYKLLDYKPEPWTKLKTALIMKYMGNMLSGYEEDMSMSNLMLALGETTFNKLYPDFPSYIAPDVPDPGKSRSPFSGVGKPSYLDFGFMSSGPVNPESAYNPRLGSNSWAVAGKKTKSGNPILCNDPHLGLTLPSIWVEMQLSAPGMNVYGVAIPGTPAIIIGFNEHIAWGITNGQDDVKDWFKLKITNDYKRYFVDGAWRDLSYSVEEIKRRDQAPFSDTVYHTIHGPIVIDKTYLGAHPELLNYALKWGVHDPSNEFLAFIKLNKAHNYSEYKDAIRHYSCPIQNFVFAGKDDTIAVCHQGKMRVKYPGEGKFIMDGTKSLPRERYIPEDSLPETLNPSCHYVFSANQHPTFGDYPYYYNGYFTETRARRIRNILESTDKFDIGRMEAMQLDNTNAFAVDALPVLFAALDTNKLSAAQRNTLTGLRNWQGTYNLKDEYSILFEGWWADIRNLTWDELDQYSFHPRPPADYTLLGLIRSDPSDIYFDRQFTTARENATDIVTAALISSLRRYDEMRKEGNVAWGGHNRINVMHLTNMEAFSRMGIPSGGHPEAIDALSSSWGPSWRMIVELGSRPKAFGIYAGGQSGNIGSAYYDNFIDDWNKGKYYILSFFLSQDEAQAHAKNQWLLH